MLFCYIYCLKNDVEAGEHDGFFLMLEAYR